MPAVNYAVQYAQALAQAYPNVLHFARFRSTENDSRYRWVNADTIQIPSISTTGRVDGDRDTIGTAKRNHSNAWESKQLTNHRKWSTLEHPMNINETNHVLSIQNTAQLTKSIGYVKSALMISKKCSDLKLNKLSNY